MEAKIVFFVALIAFSYGTPVAQKAKQNYQTSKFKFLEDIVHMIADRKQPTDAELYSLTMEQIADISITYMLKKLCDLSRARNATAELSRRNAKIAPSSGSQIKEVSLDKFGPLGEIQVNDTSDGNVKSSEINNSGDDPLNNQNMDLIDRIDNNVELDQRRAKRATKCKYIVMYDPRGLPFKTVKVC